VPPVTILLGTTSATAGSNRPATIRPEPCIAMNTIGGAGGKLWIERTCPLVKEIWGSFLNTRSMFLFLYYIKNENTSCGLSKIKTHVLCFCFVLYKNENTSCSLSKTKTHPVLLYLRICGLSKIKTHRCFFIYVYLFKNKT